MDRGRGRMLPLLAIHAASEYYMLERKPPVTAALLAANTIIYLRPTFLRSIIPSIDEVWFNPHLIIAHRDLKRFLLSAFYHVGEPHLVFYMLSLLWKGIELENSTGSAEFASMVAALLAMSQEITLLLAKSLLVFFDYESPYYSQYAVGFSGVLFAMKVVLNSQLENYTDVHGILIVPSRYAAWVELILIQLLIPGVSFLGHLGGILAGILYLQLKGTNSGSDPLTALFRALTSALSWPIRIVRKLFRSPTRRISGRGTSAESRRGSSVSGGWRCQACTYENIGSTSMCWTCGSNRNGDGFTPRRLHRSHDLPLEELRRRRIDRFGRDDVFVRQHSPSSPRSPIWRVQ